MDTMQRQDFGIWTYLMCAVGCVAFVCRGLMALLYGQGATLEGSVYLTIALVAAVFVGRAIWKLAGEARPNGQCSPSEFPGGSDSLGRED
jgi:hypothetical protein